MEESALSDYQNDQIESHSNVRYQNFPWMESEMNGMDNPTAVSYVIIE